MNSIEAFISRYCSLEGLTKKQRRDLVVETIRYIYRITNAMEYSRRFRKIYGKTLRVIDLRKEIISDGYVMKNFKLWLYYVYANGLVRKQRQETAAMFGIAEQDIEILSFVSDYKKDFDKMVKAGYKALTLDRLDKNLDAQLKSKHLRDYAAKFVYKKMKFIVQTQSVEHQDLIQEVMGLAVKAIYFYYPRIETFKHCQNILKKTLNHAGKNLIEFYTYAKRNKLRRQEDGGFASKIVPMSFAVTDDSCADFLSSTIDNSEKDYDTTLDVRRVLSKYSGKRQKFLHLIMHYDKDFSDWLLQQKITRLPNDVFLERCSDTNAYMMHVLDYLGVNHAKGMKFISTLQRKLA